MGIVHLKDLAEANGITGVVIRKFEAWLNELGIKPAYEIHQEKGRYKLYKEDEVTARLKEWLEQKNMAEDEEVVYADLMTRLDELAARQSEIQDQQKAVLEMLHTLHAKLDFTLGKLADVQEVLA